MSSWFEKRKGANGKYRYRARYRDPRGVKKTVDTYKRARDAENAAEEAYQKSRAGRIGDPTAGKITFREYVTERWLPFHVMEVSTRQGYGYQIERHLIPRFGDMKMLDLRPLAIREWITHLQTIQRRTGDAKLSAKTIRNLKAILSAICASAVVDEVLVRNPCHGLKTPTVAKRIIKVITPEQFDILYAALPDGDLQLLIETDIETGLRWSELIDLRPRDFSEATTVITVSHSAVEVNPKYHPQGRVFVLKQYPKDGEHRRIKVSKQLAAKIARHIEANTIGDDELLFEFVGLERRRTRPRDLPNPDSLGFTEPNEHGRTYRHGTKSAYQAGKCRCQHCRNVMATYRATRRAAGKDRPPRPRRVIPGPPEKHISRDWFRDNVWHPALKTARLGIHVRVHDLRHAHASWLLAGGADPYKVKERLGHGTIKTTEQYLHALPDQDNETIDAFTSIRNRSRRG
jgi:integrase